MGWIWGIRRRFWLLSGVFVALGLLGLPGPSVHAATITVTTDDGGAPVVNGLCSLREAVENATLNAVINGDCAAGDAAPTLDTIQFNIGGGGAQTIALAAALNNLTGGPLTIDATTQPGPGALPRITLDGNGAGVGTDGFPVFGADVTIRGFAIVRFSGSGVRTNAGAQRTTIEGNHIGVNAAGNAAAANGGGVTIDNAFTAQIGGTSASQRNVISGNTTYGIVVQSTGTATIQGNYVGTSSDGTAALPNGTFGIWVTLLASNVTIGGTASGAGNLVSGNGGTGIFADSDQVSNLVIQGNRIGTNLSGTAALANGENGIQMGGADGAQIGGTAAGAGNLISGNTLNGILLDDNADNHQISGNLIGLNAAGTAAIPNIANGIRFALASGNVGDGSQASRNTISGNGQVGVLIDSAAHNVGVTSAYIGVNQAGTAALPNGTNGVTVRGTNHGIGGNGAAAGNLISGNAAIGVQFDTAQLVDVRNNLIGTNPAGTGGIPNGGAGISVTGSNRIDIGNVQLGNAGNTIAFNGAAGVSVATSDRIGIAGNRIFSNGGLGIDLAPAGVTLNDAGDPDAGANNLQNFPVIQTAVSEAALTVMGTLNTTASTAGIRIQVFSSTSCDPSGFGEGQRFLGEVTVSTDAAGNVNWQATGLPAVGAGAIITATAASPQGFSLNTSEFSACVVATGLAGVPDQNPNNDGDPGGKPKTEKADEAKETEDQKRERERTNKGGADDYRTEGNVVAVDLDAKPRTATIATRDGLQVVVLLCRDSCDTPKVGDYLEAEGQKEHELLFYADSVRSRRPR